MFSGKRDKEPAQPAPKPEIRQIAARKAFCRICNAERTLSRCWQRLLPVTTCQACKTHFERPAALYAKPLPACPKCGEYLEQPGFEYGLCDGCGSKYEVVGGTRPSLLPNKAQRDEMNKFGKSWSRD